MRAASGWDNREQYADFLALQHSARAGVEKWLADHAPEDLTPPAQCQLISADLEWLNRPKSDTAKDFALDLGAEQPSRVAALGIGWVLAGSSLGNRAILHELKRKGHGNWPHAFLSDPSMIAYWNHLRPMIETPADDATVEVTALAARSTFEHFLSVAGIATRTDQDGAKGPVQAGSGTQHRDPAKQAEAEIQAVLNRSSKSYPAKPHDSVDHAFEVPVVDAPVAKRANPAAKANVAPGEQRRGPNKRIPV